MGKTFYGYWTCSYCGRESRGDVARCPGCGKTRSKDVLFYPTPKGDSAPRQYVEGYEASGGDWLCSYCDSLIAAALIIALLVYLFLPKEQTLTVVDKQWYRSVDIEEYRTVHEEDWAVPDGGRQTGSFQDVHHYVQALDHYETVRRSRQVPDGGHSEVVGYRDNGDGTFTEETRWVTDYRTEYYTEEEPVYVPVPVFATKYAYDIERWVYDHTEETSGHADQPYFADPPASGTFRQNGTQERYSITTEKTSSRDGKTNQYDVSYEDWLSVSIGDQIRAKVGLGNRLELLSD